MTEANGGGLQQGIVVGSLFLSIASSVAIVICNKSLIITLDFLCLSTIFSISLFIELDLNRVGFDSYGKMVLSGGVPYVSCISFNILAPFYKRLDKEDQSRRESDYKVYWLARNRGILDRLLEERSSIIFIQVGFLVVMLLVVGV